MFRHRVSLVALVINCAVLPLRAQSTSVEYYGTTLATKAVDGLGFNVNDLNAWEYAKVAELGGTWERTSFGWPDAEPQNADSSSAGYVTPTEISNGLNYAAANNLHPDLNASYGPSMKEIVVATTSADVPVGARTIPLTPYFTSEYPLSAAVALRSTIAQTGNQAITPEYTRFGPGALITAINLATSTVTISYPTNVPIPAGTIMKIANPTYPPVLTNRSSFMTHPGVVGYVNYARYVAQQIVAAGLTGAVEIWNEPEQSYNVWDYAISGFDTYPAGITASGSGLEIVLALANSTPIAGIKYISSYTQLSNRNFLASLPYLNSVHNTQQTVDYNSFHPYGNTPEQIFWIKSCIEGYSRNPQYGTGNIFNDCTPPGEGTGSTAKGTVLDNFAPQSQGGVQLNVTETNFVPSGAGLDSDPANQVLASRFMLRHVLGIWGLQVSPVIVYRLSDPGEVIGWVNYATHANYPVATSFKQLMADVKLIARDPVAPVADCMMPQAVAYSGTFPLATTAILGATPGAKSNSMLFFAWQRSYAATWATMASPAAVSTAFRLPLGMTVTSVTDMTTLAPVTFTVIGRTLSFPVADGPIEVKLVPTDAAAPPTTSCT